MYSARERAARPEPPALEAATAADAATTTTTAAAAAAANQGSALSKARANSEHVKAELVSARCCMYPLSLLRRWASEQALDLSACVHACVCAVAMIRRRCGRTSSGSVRLTHGP
jgi:hypothetical protein